MKSGDFVAAWGGIAGVQSTLAVLLEAGHHERALPLERIASLAGGGARTPLSASAARDRWSREWTPISCWSI